jgi:hypothetical protein
MRQDERAREQQVLEVLIEGGHLGHEGFHQLVGRVKRSGEAKEGGQSHVPLYLRHSPQAVRCMTAAAAVDGGARGCAPVDVRLTLLLGRHQHRLRSGLHRLRTCDGGAVVVATVCSKDVRAGVQRPRVEETPRSLFGDDIGEERVGGGGIPRRW